MESSNIFRNSAFGGFNKKDVAAYIEEMVKKLNSASSENESLSERCSALEAIEDSYKALKPEYDSALVLIDELKSEIETLRLENTKLTSEKEELQAALTSSLEQEGIYRAANERIAALEVEATKRSLETERATKLKCDEALKKAADVSMELQTALECIKRDSARIKERVHSQISALESGIDELASFAQSRQVLMESYIHDETMRNKE